MSVPNPYADLRALLDATRRLTPEEMAELQLEQGYVDRALRIYDELAAGDPDNASYATRRAWLARMAAARHATRPIAPRTIEPRTTEAAPAPERDARPRRATLHGIGAASTERARVEPAVVRELRIVRVR